MEVKFKYYKYLFLILFFISQTLYAQNPNPKGITVITHGFQLGGDFGDDEYWYDFAAAIKKRAGNGATIYTNDLHTGLWVRLSETKYNSSTFGNNGTGNPNEEIIFLLNWSPLSNISYNLYSDGQLESAADHLFSMLSKPPQELNFNVNGGIWNSTKPIHMIGHSRGTILNIQICHRVLKYFPSRLIDQYTSLDPHPGVGKFAIYPLFNYNLLNDLGVSYFLSLPGVKGDSKYGNTSIILPNNVVKSDSYFRRDGVYELSTSVLEGLDFDGVPNKSAGNFNREMKNDDFFPPQAHSKIHQWYWNTIDTTLNAPAGWFTILNGFTAESKNPKFSETRSKTGYFYSRLGGGYNLLPDIVNSTNLSEMDSRIAYRSNGKLSGLQEIFNGHFNYDRAGWIGLNGIQLTNGEIILDNNNKFLKLSNLNETITHNWLYFQPNSDYLTFKAKANQNFSVLGIKFYDGAWTQLSSTQLIINPSTEFKDYFVTIPPALRGKTGTFKLEWLSNSSSSEISIDDIDVTNNAPTPTASITALGETTFCNATQTVQLKASTTDPDYEYQWQKNGSNIAAATDTIYTAQSAGDYTLKVTSKSTALTATSEPTKVDFKTLTDFTVGGGGTVEVGEAIALNATGGEYYLWEGPNGFVSNLQYPVRYSATATMSGNYTVKIKAKSGCSASANVSVNVIPASGNSTNCPPLIRSVKSIDYSTLGSANYTQPFSNDKYVTILYKDNSYSLALLDSNLAVIWRKTLSSNATEVVTDNNNSIFVRIGNSITRYNSVGGLVWSNTPTIKIVQTLRTNISYPYYSNSTNTDININPGIVSIAPSSDGGVSIVFNGLTYKNKTIQDQYYDYNAQRIVYRSFEYSYTPVNNNATETNDIYVAKIASNGTVSWWKTFGDACTYENPIKIKSTSNGGYIFMGKSCNNLLKTYRIDANGNSNWSSQLTLSNNSDSPVTLSEASDGGALVGVDILRNNQYDMWFGKISSGGGLSWSKTFGGQTGHLSSPTSTEDRVLEILSNGSTYYLSGIHKSVDGGVINNTYPYYYYWLANITQNGNVNWSKKYSGIATVHLGYTNSKVVSLDNNGIFQFYNFNSANFQLNSIEKLCQSQGLNLEVSKENWSNNETYIKSYWYKNGKKIDELSSSIRSVYQDGTYHAKIEMTNGCTVVTPPVTIITPKISSNAIYVYNTASNGYQYTSNGLCEGATLNLTSEGGDSYSWTGPNGFVSNLQNPSIPNITTSNGGIYYCTITNTKRNCNVTLSTEVKVLAHPIAPLRTNSPVEEGQNLSLNYHTNYNIIESEFSGPNGLNLIFPPNSHKYGFNLENASVVNSGTYTIKLRQGNCVGTYTQNLVVNPCPLNPVISYFFYNNSPDSYSSGILNSTNSFCIKPNTEITLGTRANISNNDVYGYKFQWYRFGVPIANATNSYIYINQSGTYSVKVSRNGRCEKFSPNYVVNVNYEPEFTTNIPTPKPICQGQGFTFQASPQTNNYQWTGPNNFNTTGHTIAVTNIQPSRSGNYIVKATNNAGCSLTKQAYFQVEENPKSYSGENKFLWGAKKEGERFGFYSDIYGGSKYFWEGPNNFNALTTRQNSQTPYNYVFPNPAVITQSGTYKLTVETDNGCRTTISSILEIKKIKIQIDKSVLCKNEKLMFSGDFCDGTILWSTGDSTIIVKDGIRYVGPGYIYSTNPSQNTTYTARCKVGNFIGTISDPITVQVHPDPPKPIIRADNNSVCYPDVVTLRSSGCAYQTSWGPYSTTVTDSVLNVNLPNGTHKLAFRCTSADGCTTGLASDTITINVFNKPNRPYINLLTQSSYPAGQNITLNAQFFGSPTDTLIWSNGMQGNSITVNPVVTTTYTVYAKNASGCLSEISPPLTVTINGALPLTIQSNTAAACAGSSINLSATGCSGTVLWSTGQTGLNISTVINSTTTYSASCIVSGTTISNSNGLTVNVVLKLPTPQIQADKVALVIGEGVTLTAQGCANTVKWSNGSTGNNITVFPTNTTRYRAICTYGSTCVSDSSNIQSVTVFANGTFGISSDKDSVCRTHGEIQRIRLDAVGCPNTVHWSNGRISNASLGNYIDIDISGVNISDFQISAICKNGNNIIGISNIVSIKIKNSWFKPRIVASKTIICKGENLKLTALGCPSNNVLWSNLFSSNSDSTFISNNWPIGKQRISVWCKVDENCLSLEDSISITVLQECNFSVSTQKNSLCQGDSTLLNAIGCTNGNILWSDGSTNTSIIRKPTLTTKYLANCTVLGTIIAKDSITITVNQTPTKPSLSTPDNQICYPATVSLKTSGCDNNLVDWSPYSATHSDSLFTLPLSVGTYKLTSRCKTIAGCLSIPSDSLQVIIRQTPNRPYIFTPPSTNISSGQLITLNASVFPDSIGVLWSSGQTTKSISVSPSATTIYKVKAKSSYCESTYSDSVIVSVNGFAALSIASDFSNVCMGQTVNLTSGGCTGDVVWSDGQIGANVSKVITINQTVSAVCNVNGVTVSNSNFLNIGVISKHQSPIISASMIGIIAGDSTQLNASGCLNTVYWSNGKIGQSIYVAPLSTSTYKAVCGNGICQSDSSNLIKISVFTSGTFGITANKDSVCAGDLVSMIAIGCNYQIFWSNGMVGSHILIPINTNTTISAICKFGTNTIGVSNTIPIKIKYKWLKPTLRAENEVICQNSYLKLNAKGCAYRYLWSNGTLTPDSTITIYSPATGVRTYSVSCQNEDGCQSQTSENKTIVVQASCSFKINASEVTICKGNTTTLSVAGCSGSVNWSTGNISNVVTVSPESSTKYLAKCTEENGIYIQDSLIVTVKPAVQSPSLVASDTVICYPNSIRLTASGCSGDYDWSSIGYGLKDSTLNIPLSIGTYQIGIRCKSQGCVSESSNILNVIVHQKPNKPSIISPLINFVSGQMIRLDAVNCSAQDSVIWSNGMIGKTINFVASEAREIKSKCQNNNCEGEASEPVNLIVNGIEPLRILADKNTVCVNQAVNLKADGCVGQVVWSNNLIGNDITITPDEPIEVSAICIENQDTVSVSSQLKLNVLDYIPSPKIYSNLGAVLQGSEVEIYASGCIGLVKWNTGQQGSKISVKPAVQNQYRAFCQIGNCISDSSNKLHIKLFQSSNFNITSSKDSVCVGEMINLNAVGCNNEVFWSNGSYGNSQFINLKHSTNISAVCILNDTIIGTSNEIIIKIKNSNFKPIITLEGGTICSSDKIVLKATNCPNKIQWYPFGPSHIDSSVKVTLNEGSQIIFASCLFEDGCFGLASDTINYFVRKGPITPLVSPGWPLNNANVLHPKGTIISINVMNVSSHFPYSLKWYIKNLDGLIIDTVYSETPNSSLTYVLNESRIFVPVAVSRFCESLGEEMIYKVDDNTNVICLDFNGSIQDGSGRNHIGDIRGQVIPINDRFNNSNSSFLFPGNLNSWIRFQTPIIVGPSMTVNVWVYRESGSSFYVLGQGRKDIISGWFGILCGDESSQKPGFGVKYGSFASNNAYAFSQENLENNRWYMLTGVLDNINNKIKFYVNGQLKGEAEYFSDNVLTSDYPLAIGRHTASGYDFMNYGDWPWETYPFKGKIDDVCIQNVALTDSQILGLFSSDNCQENVILNSQSIISANKQIVANKKIISNSLISNSNVIFSSGGSIELEPGFFIEKGTIFKTELKGCK